MIPIKVMGLWKADVCHAAHICLSAIKNIVDNNDIKGLKHLARDTYLCIDWYPYWLQKLQPTHMKVVLTEQKQGTIAIFSLDGTKVTSANLLVLNLGDYEAYPLSVADRAMLMLFGEMVVKHIVNLRYGDSDDSDKLQ